MGIANACFRVRAGARARSGCSAWSGCPCMRTERPRASLTSVPAHDPRIPQRSATRTKIGPPRRARVDARDARERTRAHVAWTALGLEPRADRAGREGGPSTVSRGRATPAIAARSHQKTIQNTNSPTPIPPQTPKKSSKIFPPHTLTPSNAGPPLPSYQQRAEEKCRNMASWSHQVLGRSSLRSHALPRCCCLWLCAERAGAHGGACARRVDGRREDGVRRRSRFKQPSCIPQLRRACAERSASAAPAWSSAWSRLVHTAHRVPDANPTLLRLPSR